MIQCNMYRIDNALYNVVTQSMYRCFLVQKTIEKNCTSERGTIIIPSVFL